VGCYCRVLLCTGLLSVSPFYLCLSSMAGQTLLRAQSTGKGQMQHLVWQLQPWYSSSDAGSAGAGTASATAIATAAQANPTKALAVCHHIQPTGHCGAALGWLRFALYRLIHLTHMVPCHICLHCLLRPAVRFTLATP
jgi:hypothetical protein